LAIIISNNVTYYIKNFINIKDFIKNMKHSLNPQHNTTAGSHPVKSSIRWHNIRTSSYWNIFKLSACFFLIIILLYFTHIGCPIKEARANADYVVAVVHWGTEHTTVLEDVQRSSAREYIDAGADVIIGGHNHCLQGIEYYSY
jgi:hypothetical protein